MSLSRHLLFFQYVSLCTSSCWIYDAFYMDILLECHSPRNVYLTLLCVIQTTSPVLKVSTGPYMPIWTPPLETQGYVWTQSWPLNHTSEKLDTAKIKPILPKSALKTASMRLFSVGRSSLVTLCLQLVQNAAAWLLTGRSRWHYIMVQTSIGFVFSLILRVCWPVLKHFLVCLKL